MAALSRSNDSQPLPSADVVDLRTKEPWTPATAFAWHGSQLAAENVEDLSAEPVPDEPTEYVNDAEIWGEWTPEVSELPIAISTAKDRNIKKWHCADEAPFADVFVKMLSKHVVGKKEGTCFVTGTLGEGGLRTKNNVIRNYMIGLDIDSGYPLEDAFRLVREAGLTCIFYTTHSHLTTRVEIAYDKFYAWAMKLGVDPDAPSDSDVRRYMLGEGKYVSAICNSATFVEKTQANGMKIVVATTPIPKFRMVFPLAKPFMYKAQLGAHRDVISLWSRKVLGLGRQYGVEPDNAARDPSRLFYLPRHRKGSTGHRIMLTLGKLIRFEDIPEGNPHAKQSNDPFDKAGAAMGATKGGDRLKSPELGIDLMTWAAKRAHGFDIAQVFKDYADDRIRAEQSDSKLTIECPHDDDHSNPGDSEDQGCFVQSAGADAETFSFHCSHAGCHGRDRLAMMQKAMQEGWFPESVLSDPAYDVSGGEDDDDAAAFDPGKRAEVFADVLTRARECTDTSSDEVVGTILAACLHLKDTETSRVLSSLSKSTGMRLPELKAMLKERRDEAADDKKASRSKTHFKTAADAIAALNKEIAFVERGTGVMIVQKRPVMDGWKSIKAAEDVYRPWTYGKDLEAAFKAWIASPQRDHRTDIVFEPFAYGVDDPTPGDLYNMYRGFDIEPEGGDWMSYQRHVLSRPGFAGGSNFQIGWSHDEQNDE